MTPTFQGEIQFRRYSDTSTQGQQIVFSVPDREALQPFIGKEGKRFMAVLVEIGDDERPVNDGAQVPDSVSVGAGTAAQPPAAPSPEPAKRAIGPICQWLVFRCKEPEFQEWLRSRGFVIEGEECEEEAAYVVRKLCSVASRADIDGNREAEAHFQKHIRGEYSKWLAARGK